MTIDEYTRLADDGCPNTGEHVRAKVQRRAVWYRTEAVCETESPEMVFGAQTLQVTPLINMMWTISEN